MLAERWKERLIVEGLFHDESMISVRWFDIWVVNEIYLSKIITAGVTRVAEPAATRVSAASSSPSRLPLRWMPKGMGWSWRFWVMILGW